MEVVHGHPESLPLHDLRILLVEDNDDLRFLIGKKLRQWGSVVDEAIDGKVALQLTKKHTYDIILMDLQMPRMDGLQAATKLRSLGILTPIIAVTANLIHEDNDPLPSEFNAYARKPLNMPALLQTILSFKR